VAAMLVIALLPWVARWFYLRNNVRNNLRKEVMP
jgi:hypothetical protein